MELGEPIAVTLFVDEGKKHSKDTCPWHKEPSGSAKKMDPQDGDEDTDGEMPDNSGKKLGKALEEDEDPEPQDQTIEIMYAESQVTHYPSGGKKKILQLYEEVRTLVEYPLQYAPHHAIPGNESLKGSSVVQFLGDDDVIANFQDDEGSPSSVIKQGQSVGYDVNAADNGIWLPSPYALSNSNEWPAAEGLKALRKRRGGDASAAEQESFKYAYACEAIETGEAQFHMRHAEYSTKVREILDSMGAKIKALASVCPIVKDSGAKKKFDAPPALGNRLNALSDKLKGLLRGTPATWRNPLFTDELTKQYVEDYKGRRKRTPKLKVM
jgi:hypothetical protein